jgi:NADH-quinone oxidoreductase subunit K/NAD(P)H-quinone oxidoreductase subunit 4L
MNSLYTYLFIAILLFTLGIVAVFLRRSLIGMLIGIELMLNAANINFMAFNRYLAPDPLIGQIYTVFIMGIAAAEAAIALSIIIAVFHRFHSINVEQARELRG